MDKFTDQVIKTMERMDMLVGHFLNCDKCSSCMKQDKIIQAIDNITGELRRSLRNKKATLLPSESLYKESAPVFSKKQVFPWWGKEDIANVGNDVII